MRRFFTAAQNVRFWHKADMETAFGDVCFRGNSGHWGMSVLPPKADIGTHSRNVRFVPIADIIRGDLRSSEA